jgi:hypothetical protein
MGTRWGPATATGPVPSGRGIAVRAGPAVAKEPAPAADGAMLDGRRDAPAAGSDAPAGPERGALLSAVPDGAVTGDVLVVVSAPKRGRAGPRPTAAAAITITRSATAVTAAPTRIGPDTTLAPAA